MNLPSPDSPLLAKADDGSGVLLSNFLAPSKEEAGRLPLSVLFVAPVSIHIPTLLLRVSLPLKQRGGSGVDVSNGFRNGLGNLEFIFGNS